MQSSSCRYLCGVAFPALLSESLFYHIFSSHFLVEVSSFWWSKSPWSLQRGIFIFPWINRRKISGGKQVAGVVWFWDLYSVAELCKRSVTFSAAILCPCHKGSAIEFCVSAALVFSVSLAVLVRNCKVTQPVFLSSFTGSQAARTEFCMALPGASWLQLPAGLCQRSGCH